MPPIRCVVITIILIFALFFIINVTFIDWLQVPKVLEEKFTLLRYFSQVVVIAVVSVVVVLPVVVVVVLVVVVVPVVEVVLVVVVVVLLPGDSSQSFLSPNKPTCLSCKLPHQLLIPF